MRTTTRSLVIPAVAVVLMMAACENAGSDRSLGLDAAGTVRGSVYFDANGSRTSDAGDSPFAGAGIRLLAPVSRDTLFRASTAPDGTFEVSGVPVGTYAILIDSASAGDTARVIGIDAGLVTVAPGGTVEVTGSISFPLATAAEVRTLAAGTRVLVKAIALHARTTFSDTLLHAVDTSGALRSTRVRPSNVAAGDSVVLRGRVASRLGQPSLDDVTVFIIAPTFVPTAPVLTTAAAATAAGGTLDGQLVSLLSAEVTDTATVGGHLTMTMDDGSGPVTVMLDRAADVSFRPPLPPALWVAPRRFDVIGVLVPTGSGSWVVRPRSALDFTPR